MSEVVGGVWGSNASLSAAVCFYFAQQLKSHVTFGSMGRVVRDLLPLELLSEGFLFCERSVPAMAERALF